jgi:N-acetylglucosamine kinase-like BadF-type ATPase
MTGDRANRNLLLAVDAGNTKTEAAVVRASDGAVLGIGRGGVGDIYSFGGADAAARVVVEVVGAAFAEAAADPSQIAHAAFRLAGVDWSEDEDFWRDVISRTWPQMSASIKNDGLIFSHIANPAGDGVSVVLGTGGAFGGAGPAGEFAVSWWLQHSMGASGLLAEAIRAATLAEMGMGPPTRLQQLLPELLDVPDMGEVLHVTTRRDSIWHHGHLAALAPSLMELLGVDHVLTEIVQAMARHVAEYVGVLRQRCGLGEDLDVAVGGGMVRGAPRMGELVRDQIIRAFPLANVTLTSGTALDGAIRTVQAEAGQLRQRINAEAAKTRSRSS